MSTEVTREGLLASVHQLQSGDVLIIRTTKRVLSAQEADEITQIVEGRLHGLGIRVLVHGPDFDISAWRPAKAAECPVSAPDGAGVVREAPDPETGGEAP